MGRTEGGKYEEPSKIGKTEKIGGPVYGEQTSGSHSMAKDTEMLDKKPISLVEARKKIGEHKAASRIEGKKRGKSITSRQEQKPLGRKRKA